MTQWFRMYGEVLTDRKLARVTKTSGQPRVVVLGLWTTLLCLASDSPERGRLLLTEDHPYSAEDLADETGLDTGEIAGILNAFADLRMVAWDGDVLTICAWSERQYESDVSTERVRRFRAKQRNGSATTEKRFGNSPDTESDTEQTTETEAEQTAEPARAEKRAPRRKPAADAVQAVDSADFELLAGLGVAEPVLSQVLKLPPAPGVVEAWVTYARGRPSLENPAGFVIRRLLEGDDPPKPGAGKNNGSGKPTWYSPEEFEQFFEHGPGSRGQEVQA